MSQPPSSHSQDYVYSMCVCDGGRCKRMNLCMFMSAHDLMLVSVQPHVTADVARSLSSVMCCPLTFSNI